MNLRRPLLAARDFATPRGSGDRAALALGELWMHVVVPIGPEGVGAKYECFTWLVRRGEVSLSGRPTARPVTDFGSDWKWTGAWLGRPLEALPFGEELRQLGGDRGGRHPALGLPVGRDSLRSPLGVCVAWFGNGLCGKGVLPYFL